MASLRAASSRVRSDASLIADVSATLCRDLGLGAVNKSLGKRAVSDAIRFSGRYAQFLEKVRGTGDVSEPVAKQIHEQVARRVDLAVKQLQHEAKSSGAGGGGIAVAGFGTVGNVERLPGTISGAAGGLIAGGLMKPTKRSRSGQQKGSSLGIDRLRSVPSLIIIKHDGGVVSFDGVNEVTMLGGTRALDLWLATKVS